MSKIEDIERQIALLHNLGGIEESHELERQVRKYPAALILLNAFDVLRYSRTHRVVVLRWELSWLFNMRNRDQGQEQYKERLVSLTNVFERNRTLGQSVIWSRLTDGGGVTEPPGAGVIFKPMLLEARDVWSIEEIAMASTDTQEVA